jgi:catecholate siderophore receptor
VVSRRAHPKGGLRLDKYKTRQTNPYASTTAAGGLSLPVITSTTRTEFSRDDTLANYQLGVVYKPAPTRPSRRTRSS